MNFQTLGGFNLYCYANSNQVKLSTINLNRTYKHDFSLINVESKTLRVISEAKNNVGNYCDPHWKNDLIDTNWPTFLVLSNDGFEAINWGLSLYKGSLFFDNSENHSLYISIGNIGIFTGLVFPKEWSDDNKARIGFDASASVIEIGYDGRIIDASTQA